MLVTLPVLPLIQLPLVFVLLLARPPDHVLENFLDVWLLLEEVVLFNREQLISFVLGDHDLLNQRVQSVGFCNLAEVEQNAHQLLHRFFIINTNGSFIFKHFQEVLLLKGRALLDLLLFLHFVHGLVLLPLGLLGGLRELLGAAAGPLRVGLLGHAQVL